MRNISDFTAATALTAANIVTAAVLSCQEILEPLGNMIYAARVKLKYVRQELSKNIDNASCLTKKAVYTAKDVRQLVTAERHLPPKCTNFGFFTTKVYEF